MKFIDKSTHEGQALAIIDNFLAHRKTQDGSFVNIDYQSLRDRNLQTGVSYRHELEIVIANNQQNLCCYCMRELGPDDARTLEHIIPEGLDGTKDKTADVEEYDQYVSYGLPFLTKQNVELAFVFKGKMRNSCPPYPHDISYHNIVLSCDGRFPSNEGMTGSVCCNNRRGQKEIYPVFYDSVLSSAIEYDSSGEVYLMGDASEDSFNKFEKVLSGAYLSYKTLRAIRRLWFLLCHKDIQDIEAVSRSGDDEQVSIYVGIEVTGNEEIDKLIRSIFNNVQIWNTFLKYRWFKDYYASHYQP